MRKILFAALVLFCAASDAQVYKCPAVYPGKDANNPNLPLTNASMHQGELRGNGWLIGQDEVAMEGIDTRYGFGEGEQAWLVCTYGGKKRVKGRVHDGHEWGQYMDGGERALWMKLDPKVEVCDLQVREVKPRGQGAGTWTATAICKP